MKRKLLAIIVLIVLAFGVMAFAACDDSDTLKISSYDNDSGPCGISPDVKISVEAKKEYSVDEPYIVNVEYGSTTYVSKDVERTVGYLKAVNSHNEESLGSLEEIMSLETLLEIPSFMSESNRVHYEYKNGKECGYIFNAAAEIEIPKKYFEDSSGSVALLLIRVSLTETGEVSDGGYTAVQVVLNYKVKDGKVYFSKG